MVDRFGVWLSARQIRRYVPSFAGKRVGDFGCGFQASFARTLLGEVGRRWCWSTSRWPTISRPTRACRRSRAQLPGALAALPAASLDVVLIVSVLEHVTDAPRSAAEVQRLLAPGRRRLVNVPSWRGKRYLELSAFRLGLCPAAEMDDHKMYYDVRDLWPLLVAAGFRPSRIRCFPHKFGLNTFAVCESDP